MTDGNAKYITNPGRGGKGRVLGFDAKVYVTANIFQALVF